MLYITFIFTGYLNGYPVWEGYDGSTLLTIQWNGVDYWEMLGWPYDGEPRNYNNTPLPTTGWELYNNTTITATFNVSLGACAPSPSVTPSPSITATPSATPSITPSVTPSLSIGASVSPSATPSATPDATPSVTPSLTPSVTPSETPSATPSVTPSNSPTPDPGYFNVYLRLPSQSSSTAACAVSPGSALNLYARSIDNPLYVGARLWTNNGLTAPFDGGNAWWRDNNNDVSYLISDLGQINNIVACV